MNKHNYRMPPNCACLGKFPFLHRLRIIVIESSPPIAKVFHLIERVTWLQNYLDANIAIPHENVIDKDESPIHNRRRLVNHRPCIEALPNWRYIRWQRV